MKRPSIATTNPATSEAGRARAGLSTDLIVETACELIAESHTDGLTMRKLSDRLGVALGATYHYVPNREALLKLVAVRINSGISLASTDPRRWRSTLRTLMMDYSHAYAAYPGMAAFSLTSLAATGPADTGEQVLDLLDRAGFSAEGARSLLAALLFYVSGATATDLLHRDQPSYPSELMLRRFEQGLDLVLEGASVQLNSRSRRLSARP